MTALNTWPFFIEYVFDLKKIQNVLQLYGSQLPGWVLCQMVVTFSLTLSTYCDKIQTNEVKH